jgi:hypothetical protein
MSLSKKSMIALVVAGVLTALSAAPSFAGGTSPVAPPIRTDAPIQSAPSAPQPVWFCYPNPFAPAGQTCILVK